MVKLQPSSAPPPQKAGHVGTVLMRLPPGKWKEAGPDCWGWGRILTQP